MRTEFMLVLLGVYLAMSVVSFVMYGIDKRRAQRDKPRIPERTLLGIDLAFGFPGGFVGQRVFRHKTSKVSYMLRYWATAVVHIGAWGLAIYLMLTKNS